LEESRYISWREGGEGERRGERRERERERERERD
jgi:hypothetical protein